MDKWKVIYYISPTGDNPVKEFLNIHIRAKVKAIRILSHLEEYGLLSIIPYVKKLTGTPLWEIRILGKDNVRILYVSRKEKRILLLHAFEKKKDKTPKKEIDTALNRLAEIERRLLT